MGIWKESVASNSDYIIKLFSAQGQLVAGNIRDHIHLTWARNENAPGAFEFTLPGYYQDYDIGRDYVFEIYDCTGRKPVLDGETCWFVRRKEVRQEEGCGEVLVLSGHDTLALLDRRLVAWFSANSPPDGFTDPGYKTVPAITAIKELFLENFSGDVLDVPAAGVPISVTDPEESPDTLPAFSAANRIMPVSFGIIGSEASTVIVQDVAWQKALSMMQSIAETSKQAGTPIIFDIVYRPSPAGALGDFTFQIWLNNRGIIQPVVFSPSIGNLNSPSKVEDWTEEATWVHVGGPDSGEDRIMAGVVDPKRSGTSPFYPIEVFLDLNDGSNSEAALLTAGKAELARLQGKLTITGEAVQGPGYAFGVDYGYGDVVGVGYGRDKVSARISQYSVTVADGKREISIPLSGERNLG